MIFGYARVSTKDQQLIVQTELLKTFGCDEIITDTCSGRTIDRPGLSNLRVKLRKGDQVVIMDNTRLARDYEVAAFLRKEFEEKGVTLRSLQNDFDRSTPVGEFAGKLLDLVSEFQVKESNRKVKNGLEIARARGIKGGRKLKLDQEGINALKILYDSRMKIKDIAKTLNIGKKTIYRYLDRIQQQKEESYV